MGLQEVCVNWMNFKPSQSMASMLRKGGEPIKSVVLQNKTEGKEVGNKQRGGTSTIIKDSLSAYVKTSGTDHTGLGRWSWYLLEGEPSHFTYVITAYAPCGNKDSGDATYFKQNERYIQGDATYFKQNERYIQAKGCAQIPRRCLERTYLLS